MELLAVQVLPCTQGEQGEEVVQLTGPDLSTCHWRVFLRRRDGLQATGHACTERYANDKALELATAHGLGIDPYPWAPTPLLTACAIAVRATYGYDLFDAGVSSEQDLHELGITDVSQASRFAAEFGAKHGLERIDG